MNSYTSISSIIESYTIDNINYTRILRHEVFEKSTADNTINILLIIGGIALVIAYLEYEKRIHSDLKTVAIRMEEIRRN